MIRKLLLLLLLSCVPASASPLDESRQVLVVLGKGWNDRHATLQRYERKPSGWRRVGARVPCVLGRRGLGWGRGLIPPPRDGPRKREGDMRSPAGVFRISETFGFAPAPRFSMPYRQIREPCDCVDDPESAHYNQVVDPSKVARDWKSAEHMRRTDAYRWGAFVDHNVAPAMPGAGSCIFLHIWGGPHHGTAGCTALAEPQLLEILAWMRPEDQPALIQLPREVYGRVRAEWGLP